ncbi:MAG: hypothetical protein P4M00_14895 [Azospirillaceae bacterium]|nr:hypothetical protein [Azospirillaceae bacterium]
MSELEITSFSHAGLLTSIGPALSVLLPFARSISRRYRIQANLYYCELLERRRQVQDLVASSDTAPYPGLRRKLAAMRRDIDRELAGLEKVDSAFPLFVAAAATELAAFSGLIISGLLRFRFRMKPIGRSFELHALELILQNPATRVALFMLVAMVSVLLLRQVARYWGGWWEQPLLRAGALLMVFNLLQVGITGAVFLMLPISIAA